MFLSIHLSFYLSISLSIYPSLSISLSIFSLSIHPSLSIALSIFLRPETHLALRHRSIGLFLFALPPGCRRQGQRPVNTRSRSTHTQGQHTHTVNTYTHTHTHTHTHTQTTYWRSQAHTCNLLLRFQTHKVNRHTRSTHTKTHTRPVVAVWGLKFGVKGQGLIVSGLGC